MGYRRTALRLRTDTAGRTRGVRALPSCMLQRLVRGSPLHVVRGDARSLHRFLRRRCGEFVGLQCGLACREAYFSSARMPVPIPDRVRSWLVGGVLPDAHVCTPPGVAPAFCNAVVGRP